MIIAQITDFHVSKPGTPVYDQARSHERLAKAVTHLNDFAPRPDLVLATGDLVDQGSEDEYRLLREIVAPLEMPLYLIAGNHDDRDVLRRVFADHNYLPGDGYLQYGVEAGPLRILALDTSRRGWPSGQLCQTRLDWLHRELSKAPETPTLIAMHHPPFRTGMTAMDRMGLDNAKGFRAAIRDFDNVAAVVCGHLHRHIVHRLGNTVAITAPSTGNQLALDLRPGDPLALVTEPPACLIHVWHGAPDELVSHVSYVSYVSGDFTAYPVELGPASMAKMQDRDFA